MLGNNLEHAIESIATPQRVQSGRHVKIKPHDRMTFQQRFDFCAACSSIMPANSARSWNRHRQMLSARLRFPEVWFSTCVVAATVRVICHPAIAAASTGLCCSRRTSGVQTTSAIALQATGHAG